MSDLCVNFTLWFFSLDFRLLSSCTYERFCSKLFTLKENWPTRFFKNSWVSRDSWEKEHSNCQGEDFSESEQSKDVSKSHSEYPLFRELRWESAGNCCKEAIEKKKACMMKKRKWNDDYIPCRFHRVEEEMLNLYRSAHCLFCANAFGNNNLAPGHLKIIWNNSKILIKTSQRYSLRHL